MELVVTHAVWEIMHVEGEGLNEGIVVETPREARLVLGFFKRMGIFAWANMYEDDRWVGRYKLDRGELWELCS